MDEQMIARALCKACGRDPDAILNGVPEWVARQVEARAAHSVMAGKVAELTEALRFTHDTLVEQQVARAIRTDLRAGGLADMISAIVNKTRAALAPHSKGME